ncbi:MAG TPA: methyltransferase [Myxococcales bacterium]|nr:methyltransferase [Myxococcales bacterium]
MILKLGGAGFFQAMVAGHELKLFQWLASNPGASREAVASGIGIPLYSARVLLLALCAMGLVERDGLGGYRNADWVTGAFTGEGPTFATMVDAFHQLIYRPLFHLTESLRKGTNAGLEVFPGTGKTLYERLVAYPELEAVFHKWMSNLSSQGLPPRVMEALGKATRVLDAGGGDGTNAILLARAHSHLKVTVLDLPSVCERARARVAAEGLSDRIDADPCNIQVDPFPRGADAVLFSRIFNIYGEAQNQAFVHKAAAVLPDGGQLVILPAMVCDEDETGPLSAAFLTLYFACLATGEGRVYPTSAYEEWFQAAGFSSLECEVDEYDNAVLVGWK